MTVFGWDTSNYDHDRGPMDIARARKQGIVFLSHKISEGVSFRAYGAGKVLADGAAAKMAVLGGYHVLYGAVEASIESQVSWYLQCLDSEFPGWKTHPCFIHQIDAEKFKYMKRRPNLKEINQFGDMIVERTGCLPSQVVAYAPRWLYGDHLVGLKYALWASAYVSGVGTPQSIYPGDSDFRWDAYSGITPMLLQFSSSALIAGNHTCDANAVRVADEHALVKLFKPSAQPAPSDPLEDLVSLDRKSPEYKHLVADVSEAVVDALMSRKLNMGDAKTKRFVRFGSIFRHLALRSIDIQDTVNDDLKIDKQDIGIDQQDLVSE
jgi:hypothetical protein